MKRWWWNMPFKKSSTPEVHPWFLFIINITSFDPSVRENAFTVGTPARYESVWGLWACLQIMWEFVEGLAEFAKIILLQDLLLMETNAHFCRSTVIISTKSSNVKKKDDPHERRKVGPFSFNGYQILRLSDRRSGRGRPCLIWAWLRHIFCWKIQPLLHEHRLTPAQTGMKYLAGCLCGDFPPA